MIVVCASTLLYINSYEKLYSNLNDLGYFKASLRTKKNKKGKKYTVGQVLINHY
jgi:hypothetical protein